MPIISADRSATLSRRSVSANGSSTLGRPLPAALPQWRNNNVRLQIWSSKCLICSVPGVGFEPTTCGLQNRCSTTELTRQVNDLGGPELKLNLNSRPSHEIAERSNWSYIRGIPGSV